MAIPVIMPKQGQSVETCIITTWYRKRGDTVSNGDILFSYETDKAAFDMESPADGILLDIFFDEGDEVPVLVNVAVIGEEGEETDSFKPGSRVDKSDEEHVIQADAVIEGPLVGAEAGLKLQDARIRISPRARQMAADMGIDITRLTGSGPNGRIVAADIENAPSGEAGSAETGRSGKQESGFADIPLSNVRKMIAKAMHASLQNSAQLTHHMSADVRFLLNARKKIKDSAASGMNTPDITINDMICYCVIRALKKFPDLNSHFLGDRIRTFGNVNLGLAVDTPRGLMVATVENADKMNIGELSSELHSVAEACRKGNINPEVLQSGAASFTVSNLGAYGVEMFTPVINLPQVAILGVCTIVHRPADIGNNTFGFVPFVGLSLTYDHRAVDGGPATLFLKEVKEQIEGFRSEK